MPYIRIKAYPKDQATKEKVVEAINKAFVDYMSQELYETISDGRLDFLRDHKRFGEDITQAVIQLESMLKLKQIRL